MAIVNLQYENLVGNPGKVEKITHFSRPTISLHTLLTKAA